MTDTCSGVHADMPCLKSGKPKFDYAIWDNAITMVCANDFYSFKNGLVDGKNWHDAFEGSTMQDFLKNIDELQQLKKNGFYQKPLVIYYNPNNPNQQGYPDELNFCFHLLLFHNWTLTKQIGCCECVLDSNTPVSVNCLTKCFEPMYPHIKAYHESFIQYKNHQDIQDKLQNIHHLTHCLKTEQQAQHTKTEEQISDITNTVNEWMDECDTRFTTLFGISETLQKDKEEWTVINQELEELSHLKNKVSICSSKQVELHNKIQQRDELIRAMDEQLVKLNITVEQIQKDVQNEKWMLVYFMIMSFFMYYY